MFGTIGTLTSASVHLADSDPRLLRATFPSFRPQPRGRPPHRFLRHHSVLRCFQASPLSCRLAAIPRRNRFVILRTDSSLPVTPHPASRRRSYLPLRSCGQLRQGLSPCKWHALTGVHEAATRRIRRPRLGYTNTRFEASEWQGLSWRALRPVAILQTVSSASVGLRFLDCPPGTLCLRDIVTAVLDKVERLHCRSSRATKTA